MLNSFPGAYFRSFWADLGHLNAGPPGGQNFCRTSGLCDGILGSGGGAGVQKKACAEHTSSMIGWLKFRDMIRNMRKPRFLLTVPHFSRVFELPGAKKTSKKPFCLVKHKVLFRLNVKSFGLAVFLAYKPWPNRDFWRSQSAKPRNLRDEMASWFFFAPGSSKNLEK